MDLQEAHDRIGQLARALKERNAELEYERMHWRGVVEGMAEEVWYCDAEGRMSLLNLANVTAMELSPFKDRTVQEVLAEVEILNPDGEVRPAEQAPLLRSLKGEIVRGEEMMCHLASRRTRWRQFSSAPKRDASGKITGAVAIVRDITDTKRLESERNEVVAALREALSQKDQFLATLSHELRNPLAALSTSLYLLQHVAPGAQVAVNALAVMERQMNQLTGLVNELLDVSSVSQGKISLKRQRLDLCELLRHIVQDYKASFAGRGLELVEQLPPTPVWVSGDAGRIEQVLENLLQNAGKFTRRGGSVSVRLWQEGGHAAVEVSDTGIGIAPDMLPTLFQAFTQADRSLDRTAGGLGLGLYLVKQLVELHGGDVKAASAGHNRGAVFTVRLPAETVVPSELPQSKAGAKGRRVLIVDRDIAFAESLKAVLEVEGHEARLAFSVQKGLETASMFRPHALLCEAGLPEVDRITGALRSEAGVDNVALVALTRDDSEEDNRKATEAGFGQQVARPEALALVERILSDLASDVNSA